MQEGQQYYVVFVNNIIIRNRSHGEPSVCVKQSVTP